MFAVPIGSTESLLTHNTQSKKKMFYTIRPGKHWASQVTADAYFPLPIIYAIIKTAGNLSPVPVKRNQIWYYVHLCIKNSALIVTIILFSITSEPTKTIVAVSHYFSHRSMNQLHLTCVAVVGSACHNKFRQFVITSANTVIFT